MDFENPPSPPDDYASDVRQALEIKDDELFILQPTRVVARKGIEHAIELDGYVTRSAVKETRKVLSEPGHCGEMVEHNYRVACTHFSFSVLQRTLHYYLQQHCEVKAVCGREGSAT
jgi:hypothetical protein